MAWTVCPLSQTVWQTGRRHKWKILIICKLHQIEWSITLLLIHVLFVTLNPAAALPHISTERTYGPDVDAHSYTDTGSRQNISLSWREKFTNTNSTNMMFFNINNFCLHRLMRWIVNITHCCSFDPSAGASTSNNFSWSHLAWTFRSISNNSFSLTVPFLPPDAADMIYNYNTCNSISLKIARRTDIQFSKNIGMDDNLPG